MLGRPCAALALVGALAGCDGWGVPAPVGTASAATAATPSRPANDEKTLAAVSFVPSAAPRAACPADMVHVRGNYCPKVEQRCLRYLDPPGRYHEFRCAEYAPSVCLSKQRRPLDFCIDRDEYTAPGESLPANHKSFTHARRLCAAQGKRVCRESEWNFACEGEEMRPYPYGFTRDASACNADNTDIVSAVGRLNDLRTPSGSFPRCTSPFGVRDMAGNLEEFVAIDGRDQLPAMKGAYWQPSRNSCRAAQTAHDRYYNGTETGFRCCADSER